MSNVKLHFAGAEQCSSFLPSMRFSGVRYSLLSAFAFISTCLGIKAQRYFHKLLNCEYNSIPTILSKYSKHVILDSGLFTLMFGACAGKRGRTEVGVWFDNLCQFINDWVPTSNVSCVEVDCQKILSPSDAWFFRRKMRELLPKHDIMNVWHLEDGERGLLEMIDFSNYICISIPELKLNIKHSALVPLVTRLCKTIVSRKKGMRIHLLGTTSKSIILPVNDIIYSADASSWLSPLRYPAKDQQLHAIKFFGKDGKTFSSQLKLLSDPYIKPGPPSFYEYVSRWALCMKWHLDKYVREFGPQD